MTACGTPTTPASPIRSNRRHKRRLRHPRPLSKLRPRQPRLAQIDPQYPPIRVIHLHDFFTIFIKSA